MFLYLFFFAGKQKAQAVQSPENGNQEKGHQSQRIEQLRKGADCEGAQESQLGDAEAAKGSAVHPKLLRLVALAFPLGGKTQGERVHLFKARVHPLDHVDVGNLHPGVQRQKEKGSSGTDEDVLRVFIDKGYPEEKEVENDRKGVDGENFGAVIVAFNLLKQFLLVLWVGAGNLSAQLACEKDRHTGQEQADRQVQSRQSGAEHPAQRLDGRNQSRLLEREQKRKHSTADAGDNGDENEFNGRIFFHGISSFKKGVRVIVLLRCS